MFFKVIYRDDNNPGRRMAELIEAADMGVAVLKSCNQTNLTPVLVAEFDRKTGHAGYPGPRCSL